MMRSRPSAPSAREASSSRGSTLLIVLIILGVLAAVIAAALALSGRDREANAAKTRTDVLRACAEAAGRVVWAEMANTGGVLTGGVWARNIPGGPQLNLGHFDQTFASVDVTNIQYTLEAQGGEAAGGGLTDIDSTNTFRKEFFGRPYLVFAHCKDSQGRQYEVELFARFGL